MNSRPFCAKVERSTKFCCSFVEAKFTAWNLFKLAFYSEFDFSRPDLGGNKLAKCMCLARKVKNREVCI